jgi:hypothetical protein
MRLTYVFPYACQRLLQHNVEVIRVNTPEIETRKNSASSLMCPSRSLGEVDILDLTKYLWADIWAQAAFCYQIDSPVKYLF